MSKIKDDNLYNIDGLVQAWNSGWKYLAEYANRQYPHELNGSGDKSKPYLERVIAVIDDVLCPYVGVGKYINAPKSCPSHIELLNLAASDSQNLYSPVVETIYVGPTIISFLGSSKGIPQEHYRGQLGDWSKNKKKLKAAIKK